MAEQLKLNSVLRTFFDYRGVDISEYIKGFRADEALLEKDLNRILKAHGRRENAAVVSEGDTVTINCRSALSRFSKANLPVIIGRGLFDRELEAKLIGAGVGQTLTLEKDSAPVEIDVIRCTHTVLPELTDESVKAFGIEGVKTVSALRAHCIAKQIEGFLLEDENPDMASAYVWQEVAKHIEIERDPDEEALMRAQAAKKLAEIQQRPQEPVEDEADADEEAADEEAEGAAELPAEFFENMYLSQLDLAVMGEELMRREGRCVTVDDYEAYIGRLVEAYPNKTEAEIRKEHDPREYAISEYADALASAIDRYVGDCFKAAYAKE